MPLWYYFYFVCKRKNAMAIFLFFILLVKSIMANIFKNVKFAIKN